MPDTIIVVGCSADMSGRLTAVAEIAAEIAAQKTVIIVGADEVSETVPQFQPEPYILRNLTLHDNIDYLLLHDNSKGKRNRFNRRQKYQPKKYF